MVAITLPDGSVRSFDTPVSGAEVAAAIGPGLAKDALAIKLDGRLADLAAVIGEDARLEIVTRGPPDALELLRRHAPVRVGDRVVIPTDQGARVVQATVGATR